VVISITLLRHGRSRADDEGVHEGRYDSPLTDVGREQVRRRAHAWAADGAAFETVVCSPLIRARETAEIVASALGATVRVEPDWSERDNGQLARLSFSEADARFPAPAFHSPYHRIGVTGETSVELHARAARALQTLIEREACTILVVAHGGIINAALRCALGVPLPIDRGGASFGLGDAGFVQLQYDPDHHAWTVLRMEPGEITS
jgi:2,3-bisphosphoglycerate-dependent phosphoglycerate mutase